MGKEEKREWEEEKEEKPEEEKRKRQRERKQERREREERICGYNWNYFFLNYAEYNWSKRNSWCCIQSDLDLCFQMIISKTVIIPNTTIKRKKNQALLPVALVQKLRGHSYRRYWRSKWYEFQVIKLVHKPLRTTVMWKKESVKKSQAIKSRFPSLLNGFSLLMRHGTLNKTSDRDWDTLSTIAYKG